MKTKIVVLLLTMLPIHPVFAASLADVIEITKKSVVAVGTYMPKRSPRGIFLGTGFAIANGRLIVTNAHVLPKKIEDKSFEKLTVNQNVRSQGCSCR